MNRARGWRSSVVATVAIAAAAAVCVTATNSPARAATTAAAQHVADQSQATQPGGLVALPVLKTQQVPTRQGDNLVYRNAEPDTSFVIRPTANGGSQTLINITGNKAPTSFKFAMPLPAGAHYKLQPNGSINVEIATSQVIGTIGAPWAKDANGKTVATHYTTQGNEIVQTVDYRGSAFPVVADPSVSWHWWGVQIKFTKADLERATTLGSGAAIILKADPELTFAVWAAAGMAVWAHDHGYCLELNFWSIGNYVTPWYYQC
jgi:hypothetical protein